MSRIVAFSGLDGKETPLTIYLAWACVLGITAWMFISTVSLKKQED